MDGLADGEILKRGKHTGRHDAPGGILFILEEVLNFRGLLHVHFLQNFLGVLLG